MQFYWSDSHIRIPDIYFSLIQCIEAICIAIKKKSLISPVEDERNVTFNYKEIVASFLNKTGWRNRTLCVNTIDFFLKC